MSSPMLRKAQAAAPAATLRRIEVKVRDYCGAYIARGDGKSASCTVDAESAVKRLGEKIFGPGLYGHPVYLNTEAGVQRWLIVRRA